MLSVMEFSELSEAGVSVFSVGPVVSLFSVSVFSVVSVFSTFLGEDSEIEAGRSTMQDHDKRARTSTTSW